MTSRKVPSPVVVVEGVAVVVGDVEVGEAVVVVVADRRPHAVAVLRHPREARLLRDVGERAVGASGGRGGSRSEGPTCRAASRGHGILEPRAVREEDVQPPVLVVVEEGDASAHGLDQVFVRGRRAVVLEVDPDRRRDLGELHLGRGAAAASSRAKTHGPHPRPSLVHDSLRLLNDEEVVGGQVLEVSFRPEGQATSRESAAAARPSPKWRRRSLCE